MSNVLTLPKGVYRARQVSAQSGQAPQAGRFPFGLGREGVHEICETAHGDMAALTGFALTAAHKADGPVLWIGQQALAHDHGRISLAGLVHLRPRTNAPLLTIKTYKQVETLWIIEEAMRSGAAALVIAELDGADFTASRRLTLAASRYGVPAILLMPYTREGSTAATARWRIAPRPSAPNRFDPHAPGHPRWRAVLERSRQCPHLAGFVYNLEWNDETLSLGVAAELVTDPVRPHATDTQVS